MSSLFGKFLTILGLKRREANILVVGLDNSGKSTILNYLKRKEDQVDEVVPTVGFTVEKLSALDRNRSGISLTAFDMSGQGRYRNLWEHYYPNVEGIVFVVDSTDALRLVVARDELEMLLKHQPINPAGGSGAPSVNNSENGDQDGDDVGKHDDTDEYKTMELNNLPNKINKNGQKILAPIVGGGDASKPKRDIPVLFFANKMDLKDALPSVKISQMLGLNSFPHKQWHVQASNAITGEGIIEGIEWLIFQIGKNKKSSTNSNSNNNNSSTNSMSSSSSLTVSK